jgi:hypothetical protein
MYDEFYRRRFIGQGPSSRLAEDVALSRLAFLAASWAAAEVGNGARHVADSVINTR